MDESKFNNVVSMARDIIKIIDEEYEEYLDEDCIDILQIKNICSLYLSGKEKKKKIKIRLDDIELSSPNFDRSVKNNNKRILESEEFKKKYSFFIKIILGCLKMDVVIFEEEKTKKQSFVIIKNNYQLVKSIMKRKQKLIDEHIEILKEQRKTPSVFIDETYSDYCDNFIIRMKLLDSLAAHLDRIIQRDILERQDNLLSLIIPYFHISEEYIEEYGK